MPNNICVIHWGAPGPVLRKLSFDIRVPKECEEAEGLLELLHADSTPYKITGALFQGHGFGVAATALMQPDD